jgi:hypothetical protein
MPDPSRIMKNPGDTAMVKRANPIRNGADCHRKIHHSRNMNRHRPYFQPYAAGNDETKLQLGGFDRGYRLDCSCRWTVEQIGVSVADKVLSRA